MKPKNTGRWRLSLLLLLLFAAVSTGWFIRLKPRLELAGISSAPLTEVRRRVEANPGNLKLSLAAAQRLLRLGDAPDALRVLNQVRRQEKTAGSSDRAMYEGLIAEGEMLTGHIETALAGARQAKALDSSCIPVFYVQGLWWERQARWVEAAAVFSSIVKAVPDDDTAIFHLSSDEIKLGNDTYALALLRRACSLVPSSYLYRRALAADLAYLGEFGRAAAAFQQALKLNPASFEAQANVVRARAFEAATPSQCRQNEIPVSRLLNRSLQKSGPEHTDPDAGLDHEILGMLELHAGDTVGAQFHLEAAARLERQRPVTLAALHPCVFLNLAEIRGFNGQAKRAFEAQNESASVHAIIAEIDSVQSRIEHSPDNPVLSLQLARLYDRYHAPAEALGQYEALLHMHAYESAARTRRDALASQPPDVEADSAWAWRVISTETGMAFPARQPMSF